MVCFDRTDVKPGAEERYCVYASRRRRYTYAHRHEDIYARFGEALCTYMIIPDALSDDLGNSAYVARLRTQEEVDEFVAFVQEQA